MNERYLFRGKGNPKYNDGEWYYGHLIYDGSDYQIVDSEYGSCKRTVLPETIGQCTGAKLGEQNLFDGDLLSYIGETYEIVWDEHFLVWSVKNKKGDICFSLATILRDKKRECKLIASKWDNPELLEVEK